MECENVFFNIIVLTFIAVGIQGRPQVSDDAVVIVGSPIDAGSFGAEGTDGRNFRFPVDTSADDEAGFRLPATGSSGFDTEFQESRIPRLINGPPPSQPDDFEDIGQFSDFVIVTAEENRSRDSDFVIIEAETVDSNPTNPNGNVPDDIATIQDVVIVGNGVDNPECADELDAGTGPDAINSYYYNQDEGRCFFFFYSGVGGNANRFSTEEECEERCKSNSFGSSSGVKKICPKSAPICEEGCSLKQGLDDGCLRCSCDKVDAVVCSEPGGKTGLCKGSFPYWYYKQETKTCEPFVYGGCEAGSSANKFKTKALCQKTCSKPQGTIDVALPRKLEPSEQTIAESNKSNICLEEGGRSGICNGALTFWYFKQDTNTCETFVYGGCEAGSSQNKFQTKELCQTTCQK